MSTVAPAPAPPCTCWAYTHHTSSSSFGSGNAPSGPLGPHRRLWLGMKKDGLLGEPLRGDREREMTGVFGFSSLVLTVLAQKE